MDSSSLFTSAFVELLVRSPGQRARLTSPPATAGQSAHTSRRALKPARDHNKTHWIADFGHELAVK